MLKEYDFLAILDQNPNQRQGLLMGNQVPMLSMRDEIKQLRIDCAAARGTYNMQCGYVKELKDEITQLRKEAKEREEWVEAISKDYREERSLRLQLDKECMRLLHNERMADINRVANAET